MRSLFGTCVNWKSIVVLGLATIGLVFVAPEKALAALPLLVFAVCPLSMLLMMLMRPGGPGEPDTPPASPELAQLEPAVVPGDGSR